MGFNDRTPPVAIEATRPSVSKLRLIVVALPLFQLFTPQNGSWTTLDKIVVGLPDLSVMPVTW